MLDKKSNRGLGLFVLGVFAILLLSVVSVSAAKQLTNAEAQAKYDVNSAKEAFDQFGVNSLKAEGYDSYEGAAASSASTTSTALGVSASGIAGSIQTGINNAIIVAKPILELLVGSTQGNTQSNSSIFFTKVLLLIFGFSVVYIVLSSLAGTFFADHKGLDALIGAVIALLSVRFLEAGFVETIVSSNQAFIVAITAGLPFVLFFLVTKDFSATQRRLAWAFFAAVFIVLWIARYDKMTGVTKWVYPTAAVLALIMIILDGTIKRFRTRIDIETAGKTNAQDRIDELKDKILEVDDRVTKGIYTTPEGVKRKKELAKKIDFLQNT
ncbi:MAG: hypothetical protein AABX07_06140 [Nanoarchaeota archaeon]